MVYLNLNIFRFQGKYSLDTLVIYSHTQLVWAVPFFLDGSFLTTVGQFVSICLLLSQSIAHFVSWLVYQFLHCFITMLVSLIDMF